MTRPPIGNDELVRRLRSKKTLDIGSAPHLDGSKEAPELVEWLVNPDGPEAAALIKEAVEALTRIAEMTDIEADFDGFEAREIARDALARAYKEEAS